MNGNSEMVKISIDPSLFENNERELIEELIPAAVNSAQQKAKQAHADAVQSLTGGVDFSGLGSLFGGGEAK